MSKEIELIAEVLGELGELPPSAKEQKRLRGSQEWADLKEGVHDPAVGARDCADLIAMWRKSVNLQGLPPRVRARSLCLYAMAEGEPEVQDFRSEVLQGTLIPLERLLLWLPDRKGQVRLPDGHGPKGKRAQQEAVLRLGQLAKWLKVGYGWEADAGAAFVLGGLVPVSSGIIRTVRNAPRGQSILLEVDPSVTPAEVLASYREFRIREFGGGVRAVNDKNLKLVSEFIESGEPSFREMARKEHRTVKDVRLTIGRTWKMLTQHAYERSAE